MKHKAWLNIHGGKQQFGINYFDTYVPVMTWFAIHIIMVFGILFCWEMHQIDFVQPIETDMYIE